MPRRSRWGRRRWPRAGWGQAYAASFTATGGTPPYTFAVGSGTLPAGLMLTGAGGLSGTPTAGGTAHFDIVVTDAAAQSARLSYALEIQAESDQILPATLPAGVLSAGYSVQFSCSGASAGCTFLPAQSSVPRGLTLSSAGDLTGNPQVAGELAVGITARTAAGGLLTRAYTLSISQLSVAPAVLPAGTIGSAYQATLSASGATGTVNFTVAGGALPTGVTLSPAGRAFGHPHGARQFRLHHPGHGQPAAARASAATRWKCWAKA